MPSPVSLEEPGVRGFPVETLETDVCGVKTVYIAKYFNIISGS
jgi:hypothetical protein